MQVLRRAMGRQSNSSLQRSTPLKVQAPVSLACVFFWQLNVLVALLNGGVQALPEALAG